MSGSNIFMQLVTERGPVLGESLLEGYETSIELKELGWGMHALKESTPKKGFGAGISASGLASALGIGKNVAVQLEPLTFTRRFDVASANKDLNAPFRQSSIYR